MSEVIPFAPRDPGAASPGVANPGVANLAGSRDDKIWAVMAELGKTSRIAEIFGSRDAALADRAWRESQVRAYAHFLRGTREGAPRYSVAPIRRADLPRAWTPLPALGFLRGRFI